MALRIVVFALLVGWGVVPAFAQPYAVDIHVGFAQWSEFYYENRSTDEREHFRDWGIGGRFSLAPLPSVNVEADFTYYPSAFTDEPRLDPGGTFSANRVELLVGATVGPRFGRFRPFAKAAVGLLHVAGQQFDCIDVFPQPIECVLMTGHTLPAYDLGGGVEVSTTPLSFVRIDMSQRFLKYPGPSRTADFTPKLDGFVGHSLRLTGGVGFRF